MSRKKPQNQKTTPKAKRKTLGKGVPVGKKRDVSPNPELDRSRLKFEKGFWKSNLVPALILLAIPFLLYGVTATFGFVLDDKMVYSENEFVHEGMGGIGDLLGEDTFTGYLGEQKDLVVGGRYRPLSLVTFAIEYELFASKREAPAKVKAPGEGGHIDPDKDISPAIGHLGNVLLYALTGILIFRMLMLIFPPKDPKKWYFSLPFLVTLLFMVHPIHSEVVANIKGRDEILALLLSLGAMYFSWKYLATNKILPAILAGGIFFLACLAKENSLTFLAVIPMAVWFFVSRDLKVAGKILIPIASAAMLYLLVRYNVMGYFLSSGKEVTGLMNNPWVDASGGEKYATIFYTWLLYFKMLIFPHPLTHDYYPYQVPLVNFGDIRAIAAVLVVFGSVGLALWQVKKRTVLAFSILFFFATFSIVSNFFFTVGTMMNERFMYISSLGFCLGLVWLLIHKLPGLVKGKESMAKMLGAGLVALFVLGFGIKTWSRVPVWESGETLNSAAIQISTNSARANNFYGVNLYNQGMAAETNEEKLALFNESLIYFDKALEIYPEYLDALRMQAGAHGQKYVIDKDLDGLLDVFYSVLSVRHVPYVDQFLEYLNKRRPDVSKLANFYHHAGFSLLYQKHKDTARALKYLNWGLEMTPYSGEIYLALTRIHYETGNYAKAEEVGYKGLQQAPENGEIAKFIALSQQQLGR